MAVRPSGPLSWTVQPPSVPTDEVVRLIVADPGLQARLAASVAAAWSERLRDPGGVSAAERAVLVTALFGRAVTALRVWLVHPDLPVDLTMIGEGEGPALRRTAEGVEIALPFAWLVRVWARGLTTVWDRFVLDATRRGDGRVGLTTVGPDLAPPEEIVVDEPKRG